MSTNGRKTYEQKRKQKKKQRERLERKPRQNANESINSNPQKYVKAWEINPRIREEAMEGKKEDYTDDVATNGQRVMPRLESKRKQEMKS
jgi:hypothetical protein